MIGGLGIVELGRVQMLRRQAVIDRDDVDSGLRRHFGADIVMALESAKHESAAMKIEDGHVRMRVLR